ncbi:MAG: hypothetical protein AAGE93_08270 [Bacteroidota bacterium]
MLKILPFTLLNLICVVGNAQDSLVVSNDIVFHSPFEEEIFRSLTENADQDHFALLLAGDQEVTKEFYQEKYKLYDAIIGNLENNKFAKKGSEKKIKQLYKTLHTSFLRKYEMKNTFSSIFRIGQYNCVSATGLYAIALSDLGIDYTIRETPTHVYLIAYPKTERILVETTDPTGGYYAFDNNFKNEFVTQMRKRKLISEQEFTTQSVNSLFDKYYFTDEDITLTQLAGLQYYNDALYSMEEEKYEYARQQLEKAHLLYPSERIAYLLQGVIALCLAELPTNNSQYSDYFIRLSRFRDYDIEIEDLVQEFRRFTYEQLTQAYHISHYDTTFHNIIRNINDTSLIREISHVYYQERGRIEYNKGNYSKALELLTEACRLYPENVDNQAVLVSAIAQKLNTFSNNTKRIKLLEDYTDQLPFLSENNLIQGQLLQLYLIQFAQAYESGKRNEAEEFRQQFESKMLNRADDIPVNTDLVGRAYSLAAVYYFRKGNERETKRLINQGLEYAPNHHELLQRKRMLSY